MGKSQNLDKELTKNDKNWLKENKNMVAGGIQLTLAAIALVSAFMGDLKPDKKKKKKKKK